VRYNLGCKKSGGETNWLSVQWNPDKHTKCVSIV
jgi:hypothetical protein